MKIRVLYPTAFDGDHPGVLAGDVIDVTEGEAGAAIAAGYAEPMPVERATARPGDKRDVKVPRRKAQSKQ